MKSLFNKEKKYHYHQRTNGGFVLVYAVLVSGILLSIGVAILSITLQELVLSSSGRESQFAFYAADSAAECAIYWDIRHPGIPVGVFPTSTDSRLFSVGDGIECNGEDIADPATGWDPNKGWDITSTGIGAKTVFDMKFVDNGSCATVTVTKKSNGGTDIDSRGYNTCVANPRRVERGLRVAY